MFNGNNGYSLADIAAVSGGNGLFGGNDGNGAWWLIILFLLFFGGNWNNGFGFGGNGTGSVAADVGYNFDIHNIEDTLRGIGSSVTQGFYDTNTSLLTGFNGINTGILQSTITSMQNTNALQSQLASASAQEELCCCRTQNLISSEAAQTNYNLATEACNIRTQLDTMERDIMDHATNNTRQILDFLVQDRINALTNENQALKGQISQSEQNAYLLNALRPVAGPSYIVTNPYTGNIFPSGNYYGVGCGCSYNNLVM